MDFWVIKQLPPVLMDVANIEFNSLNTYEAGVVDEYGVENGKIGYDHNRRNSTLRSVDFDHWLNGLMYYFGISFNLNNGWGFKIDTHEKMQVADYSEGQHFDWHADVIPFSGPLDRKVSVVCLMTDPAEYTGGELQIMNPRNEKDLITIPLQKGTMVAFPSALKHRVTKVTAGVRRSATLWLNGPCYR